jgi:hypothetical protein
VGTEHEHKKTSDYCRVIIDDRGDPLKRHLPHSSSVSRFSRRIGVFHFELSGELAGAVAIQSAPGVGTRSQASYAQSKQARTAE